MEKISYGFTHQCVGDLGYVWNDEMLAVLFMANFAVCDIRKGGAAIECESLADALNTMRTIAAREISPL